MCQKVGWHLFSQSWRSWGNSQSKRQEHPSREPGIRPYQTWVHNMEPSWRRRRFHLKVERASYRFVSLIQSPLWWHAWNSVLLSGCTWLLACEKRFQATIDPGASRCTRTRSVRATNCATSTSERSRRSTGLSWSTALLASPMSTCGLLSAAWEALRSARLGGWQCCGGIWLMFSSSHITFVSGCLYPWWLPMWSCLRIFHWWWATK